MSAIEWEEPELPDTGRIFVNLPPESPEVEANKERWRKALIEYGRQQARATRKAQGLTEQTTMDYGL